MRDSVVLVTERLRWPHSPEVSLVHKSFLVGLIYLWYCFYWKTRWRRWVFIFFIGFHFCLLNYFLIAFDYFHLNVLFLLIVFLFLLLFLWCVLLIHMMVYHLLLLCRVGGWFLYPKAWSHEDLSLRWFRNRIDFFRNGNRTLLSLWRCNNRSWNVRLRGHIWLRWSDSSIFCYYSLYLNVICLCYRFDFSYYCYLPLFLNSYYFLQLLIVMLFLVALFAFLIFVWNFIMVVELFNLTLLSLLMFRIVLYCWSFIGFYLLLVFLKSTLDVLLGCMALHTFLLLLRKNSAMVYSWDCALLFKDDNLLLGLWDVHLVVLLLNYCLHPCLSHYGLYAIMAHAKGWLCRSKARLK